MEILPCGSNAQSDSKSTAGGFVSSSGLTATFSYKRIFDPGRPKRSLRLQSLILKGAQRIFSAEQNVIFDVISAWLDVLSARYRHKRYK